MKQFILLVLSIGLCAGTVTAEGHCPYGSPLKGHYCGRGGTTCPDYHFCNISPVDAYAECCPSHCPRGSPLLGTDGTPVFCGLGPSHETCPSFYYCEVAPNDAYAVCCSR